jgi:ATP-binding cassette subfamily B protein RaxB
VALHAPSGIGKTTLINIFGGLLEPSEGQLLCNGREVKNWLESYRRSIGVVLQEDGLLTGTLAENICFFDPHPDRQRIEQVAKIADIHEDIVTWPLGYFTRIGELDHALSGGQVQRLLIARALYHRPRALLLDEAFSQLDVGSENRICEGLKATGITCLVVTHRQSSLGFADRVLTMQGQYPARLKTYRPR